MVRGPSNQMNWTFSQGHCSAKIFWNSVHDNKRIPRNSKNMKRESELEDNLA
jgi:hypothetical protein